MSASNPMQINTNPSSEMEVIRGIRFLTKRKAVELDGPSPSFFKDSGEVLISKLTKLLWLIWSREEIPKDWCE